MVADYNELARRTIETTKIESSRVADYNAGLELLGSSPSYSINPIELKARILADSGEQMINFDRFNSALDHAAAREVERMQFDFKCARQWAQPNNRRI